MPYKKCPHCEGKSYSASSSGKWICPYCRRDISRVQEYPYLSKYRVVAGNVYLLPWVEEHQVGRDKLLIK